MGMPPLGVIPIAGPEAHHELVSCRARALVGAAVKGIGLLTIG